MAFDSLAPTVAFARGGKVKKPKKAKGNIKAQNIVTQVVKVNVGTEAKARKRRVVQKKQPSGVVQQAAPMFGYKTNPNYPAPGPQRPYILQSPSAPGASISISNLPGASLPKTDLQEAMRSIGPAGSSSFMAQENPAIANLATFVPPAEVLTPVPGNINIDKPSIETGGNLRIMEQNLKEAKASASAKLEKLFPKLTSMIPKKEEEAYARSAAASAPLPKKKLTAEVLRVNAPGEPGRAIIGEKAIRAYKEGLQMEREDERATALRGQKKIENVMPSIVSKDTKQATERFKAKLKSQK